MMTSMKRKVAAILAAVSLMTVATGALADYGDKDSGAKSRYKVGQTVEVYNTPLHVTTTRCKVLSAEKDPSGNWRYKVNKSKVGGDVYGGIYYSSTSTVTASDIES